MKAIKIAIFIIFILLILGIFGYLGNKENLAKNKQNARILNPLTNDNITVCNDSNIINMGNYLCEDRNQNKKCDFEENYTCVPDGCILSAPFGCTNYTVSDKGVNIALANFGNYNYTLQSMVVQNCNSLVLNKIIKADSSNETFYLPCSPKTGEFFEEVYINYSLVENECENENPRLCGVILISTGNIKSHL